MKQQTPSLAARFPRQRGAALIVSLVLMVALTVLGLSAMNMSTLELTMAGNNQAAQLAFQAAETGIDVAMSSNVTTTAPTASAGDLGNGSYRYTAQIACSATTPVPEGIYSEGGGVRAIHFDATSTGFMDSRNAVSNHTQSVYIIGPDPGNPNFNPAVSPGSC